MSVTRTGRMVRWIQWGLAAIGVVCLLRVGTVSMSAVAYEARQRALLERSLSSVEQPEADRVSNAAVKPTGLATATGRLEIPRIGLSAVVARGDDERTLSVAVGHLSDTPLPWQEGNAALAGHRDTFFRPLRRIQVGDDIHLATPRGEFRYRVTRHMVVDPGELWVLEPSSGAALTLITCYPFDFVRPAPQRFVVHAERVASSRVASRESLVAGRWSLVASRIARGGFLTFYPVAGA